MPHQNRELYVIFCTHELTLRLAMLMKLKLRITKFEKEKFSKTNLKNLRSSDSPGNWSNNNIDQSLNFVLDSENVFFNRWTQHELLKDSLEFSTCVTEQKHQNDPVQCRENSTIYM